MFCRKRMLFVVLVFAAGCRQDMHDQAKAEPLEASSFFADGRSARPLVPGTVPFGSSRDDATPPTLTRALLERGRERFDAFCSPCHARTGDGDGMIVRRGYRRPPSLHEARLREATDAHFFDVITNGFGAMPAYAAQVPAADRFAIIAYVRALQLSRRATLADVPPDARATLEGSPSPPRGEGRGEGERKP